MRKLSSWFTQRKQGPEACAEEFYPQGNDGGMERWERTDTSDVSDLRDASARRAGPATHRRKPARERLPPALTVGGERAGERAGPGRPALDRGGRECREVQAAGPGPGRMKKARVAGPRFCFSTAAVEVKRFTSR